MVSRICAKEKGIQVTCNNFSLLMLTHTDDCTLNFTLLNYDGIKKIPDLPKKFPDSLKIQSSQNL